jgi:transposase
MRQAREIIRLKFSASVPTREIARRLGLAPSTVRETLNRLESAGLVWPLPEGMGDADLEEALYANRRSKRGHRRHPEPDWPAVHRELKRKHVTLLIVWDEYISPPTRAVTAIRGFANSIAALNRSCRRRCDRRMRPASGCSSITRAMACRS